VPESRRAIPGLADRKHAGERHPERGSADERRPARRPGAEPIPSTDELVAAGLAVVVDRVLASWSGRRAPGFTRLLRAAAAGATASVLSDLVRPLVTGSRDRAPIDQGTVDRMLAGAGQGLLYGAVVEPRLPGHAVVKGAVYGSAEYWTDPMGGLSHLLGGHAPQRHLPVLGEVLDGLEDRERA